MARWVRRDQAGFTLIEMMVVLAIIALIAIFAVPSIVQALQNGRLKTVEAHARQIQAAFDEYYNDHVAYPPAPAQNQNQNQNYNYSDFFGQNGFLAPYVSLPTDQDKSMFAFIAYEVSPGNQPLYCMKIEAKNVDVSDRFFEIRKRSVSRTSDPQADCNPNPS